MSKLIVVGMQWGDEGKGKIVDLYSEHSEIVVRSQGGNNAGHTIVKGSNEYRFHLIPSGILYKHTTCVLAAGVVIDPQFLIGELQGLQDNNIDYENRLYISEHAHMILPYHKLLDGAQEKGKGKEAIGTTMRGIGPCYADKINRVGIRIADFLHEATFEETLRKNVAEKNKYLSNIFNLDPLNADDIIKEFSAYRSIIKKLTRNVESFLFREMERNRPVLFEGAQGSLLDVSFGTYPYVTSSSTVSSGVLASAGVGCSYDVEITGIAKAYLTRVGNGPFPTELSKEEEKIFSKANENLRETGTTTGRKRRIGWLDLVLLKYSTQINGITHLVVTKLDILDHLDEIKICINYELNGEKITNVPSLMEELNKVTPVYKTFQGWKKSTESVDTWDKLPLNARKYLEYISEYIERPIKLVSVGPKSDQVIWKN
ncbi:MAG: adenylosuccinate synthase [Chlamydiota bacterium]|jgi:adenylosuccinate synthase